MYFLYGFLCVVHRYHRNQRIAPDRSASAAYSTTEVYRSMSVHWAPKIHPRMMNEAFHKALPKTV